MVLLRLLFLVIFLVQTLVQTLVVISNSCCSSTISVLGCHTLRVRFLHSEMCPRENLPSDLQIILIPGLILTSKPHFTVNSHTLTLNQTFRLSHSSIHICPCQDLWSSLSGPFNTELKQNKKLFYLFI